MKKTVIKPDALFLPGKGFAKGLCLLLSDNEISDILPESGEKNAEILDFSGYTIAPPFCDYHLHFSAKSLAHSGEISNQLLSCGILTAFEGGDCAYSGFGVKRELRGTVDVKASGAALYREGFYGKAIGKGVSGAAEARELIDRLAGMGADYIKVINSGIFEPKDGTISPGGFGADELGEIIGHAAGKGLRVFCHANGDGAVREAVLAGASAIVHGFNASKETLRVMKERGAAFIPTITALASLSRIYPESSQRIEAFTASHLETVKRAHELGIKVLPGSDAGPAFIPYGGSFPEELGRLAQAGIPVGDVLASACSGTLEKGGRADFVVLDGLSVKKVFVNGQQI